MRPADIKWNRNEVFVIMPFSDAASETYNCIKDECERLGLHASRVDENVGSGAIITEIRTGILRAEFIIADLTLERPNVYYELGYAHGTNNGPLDIFLVAHAETQLHFDLCHFRVVRYQSSEELRQLMRTKFAKMIQQRREQRELQAEADAMREYAEEEERRAANQSVSEGYFPEDPPYQT